MRTSCSGSAHRRNRLTRAHARKANQMGTNLTPVGALALNATNGRPVSVEFSLVAFLSFDPSDLCSGSPAIVSRFAKAGVSDPSYNGTWTCDFDGNCNVNVAGDRLVRLSISLDFYWTRCALVPFGILITGLRISAMRACYDYVLRFAGNICLHPDELRCSNIQFFSKLA